LIATVSRFPDGRVAEIFLNASSLAAWAGLGGRSHPAAELCAAATRVY
jgi:hypothetical protein